MTSFSLFILFILFVLSLMLAITEQILFTIKNSYKMLIDVNTLVKKHIEHKKFYIKNIPSLTKVFIYNMTVK